MSKIKAGSRRQKEIFKKQLRNKGKLKSFIRVDFALWKRRNKLPSSLTIFQTNYTMPYSNYVSTGDVLDLL